MCSGGGAQKKEARRQREAEEKRQEQIKTGRATIDKTFSQFDPKYFEGVEQAAGEHYRPQFDDQFDNARQSLKFALARSGNTYSSAGAESMGDLARDRALGLTEVANASQNAANAQQDALDAHRENLYDRLNASANPAAAATQAANSAAAMTRPPQYNALGNLFAQSLNNAAIFNRAQGQGFQGWDGILPAQERQTRSTPKSSVSVVR